MSKRPRERRADPRKLLDVAWLLAGLLVGGGCAQMDRPATKVEILRPEIARSRSVVILADSYLEDFRLAEKICTSIHDDCVRCGFDVKTSENAAEIVIVPSIALQTPAQGTSAAASYACPQLVKTRAFGPDIPEPLGSLGALSVASPGTCGPRIALIVSAFRQQDWLDPQFINAPMPKIWRIVATAPRISGQEEETLAILLASAGKALEEIYRRSAESIADGGRP